MEAALAASRLGADALFVDARLTASRCRALLACVRPVVVVHDDDVFDVASGSIDLPRRLVARHERGAAPSAATLEELIGGGRGPEMPPPRRAGNIGTITWRRGEPQIGPARIVPPEFRLVPGEVVHIATPLSEPLGCSVLAAALVQPSAVVLRPHFDPESALAAIGGHAVTALVAAPDMLERILAVPPAVRRRYDTSLLRAVLVDGAAVSDGPSRQFAADFGTVVTTDREPEERPAGSGRGACHASVA